MPQRTTIAWTDYTSNPIAPKEGGWGCSKVSPGCTNCYVNALNKRFGNKRDFIGHWEFVLKEKELEAMRKLPAGKRTFVCDMTDLFHPDVPWEFVRRIFEAMATNGEHTFQVLTKRPGRMAYFANYIWGIWPPNVWAGVSVESQKYAPRINALARVPAKVRFVSAEPLLESLTLMPYFFACGCKQRPCIETGLTLHWVICSGESGPGRRPFDLEWARRVRDDCQRVGIAFFFKQGSGLLPGMNRLLDGRLWEEMPTC